MAAAGTQAAAEQAAGINYRALVNKLNPLPDGWEDALETVHMTNSIGDDVEVEKKAYDAYLALKEAHGSWTRNIKTTSGGWPALQTADGSC